MRALLVSLVVLAACGTPSTTADSGVTPDASVYVPTQTHALGLNDVTWLLPLEPLDAGSPFPAADTLLPLPSFTRLTTTEPVVRTELSRLRVVGVRFDACDRALPGPCPTDADGSLRLVLQPVLGPPTRTEDIALHAFFPIPHAELPQVVDELRALAELLALPTAAPLQLNTAFTTSPAYRTKLGALVSRYARRTTLHRLTLFGQESDHAAIVWVFRGEELQGGAMQPITVAHVDAGAQEVLLFAGDSYLVTPLADEPTGFARVVMETSFRNATAPQQLDSVKSLLAVDNPTLHTSSTAQCTSCHVSTTLLEPRATDAGIDVTTLSERYTSSTFDLTVPPAAFRGRTLRALGFFNEVPMISARVINESANVVNELEARYPPAR
jgi:hypothetical protein